MYMTESLRLSRRLRPRGQWGFYHYPYCYNNNPPQLHCKPRAQEGNYMMRWLWEESSAILPSIYIFREEWTANEKARYIYGNIEEGARAAMLGGGKPVYAYTKKKYNGTLPVIFYREIDMLMSLRLPADFGIDGAIIWGSKGDYQTTERCNRQLSYLNETIAPYAEKLLSFTRYCAQVKCSGRGRCVHRGVLDESYTDEILRETLEELHDFTTDNYVCRCDDGAIRAECPDLVQRGQGNGASNSMSTWNYYGIYICLIFNYLLTVLLQYES